MSKGKLSSTYSEKTTWGDGESLEKEAGKVWDEVLCDNLPTICFAIDREGVIRNINKWGARELGYQVAELLERSILTIIVPEEREKMQAELLNFFDKKEESLKRIKEIRIKIRLEGKEGKIKEVELLGNRFKQKLQERGLKEEDLMVGVMVLESEKIEVEGVGMPPLEKQIRQTLSLLHTTLESTADGIIAVSPDGNAISFNQKFLEMWQLPTEFMLPGVQEKRLALLQEQLKYPEGFLARVKELYDNPEVESVEVLELKDGRIFERYTQPQWLGEKIVGRVWCYRDITEAKLTERALQKQAAKERLILESLARIRSSLDLNAILQTTVDEVREFLGVDRAVVFRFFEDWRGVVAVESVRDKSFSILNEVIYDPCFGESYIIPYQRGRIMATEDVYNAGISDCHLNLLSRYRVKANLVVPILQGVNCGELEEEKLDNSQAENMPKVNSPGPKLWGLLIAHHCCCERRWQQLEVDLLKQLATQVGIALYQSQLYQQLEKANQELQRLANLDGLTQVANRRRFDRFLLQECGRVGGGPLSLILCDIDCFKAYNDTYGHQAGDVCLQKVAGAIRDAVNVPRGLVARYGGEELVVVLPNTELSRAVEVAEEIRRAVRMLGIVHAKSSAGDRITLSLGVATTSMRDCTPEMLIAEADLALYEAKKGGRDRIVTAAG
jgi:diguanylate cyclase (GGDEF)-like protein/PAS domain S-box-containing protein